MALLDILKNTPDQLADKQIQQLIAFAGAGKLKDSSECSAELREYLSKVSSASLGLYAEQILSEPFTDSGFALQDIVNEIGNRLGAKVSHGRYRGLRGENGFDGLWKFNSGHSIIVEVKSTDTYRIDLNTIARYRKALIDESMITEAHSSMLLVVGREDTGDLEAQIRGSRFAWDIRIISLEALNRLVSVKEEVDDPSIIEKIHSILIPCEFTRLDFIVEILFSAAEDIKQEQTFEIIDGAEGNCEDRRISKPVAFYDACIDRIQMHFNSRFIKVSRGRYISEDKDKRVICLVSKEHDSIKSPNYWFAFHPHQMDYLAEDHSAYIVLGCGNSDRVIVFPYTEFALWLDGLWTTTKENREYWHIVIYRDGAEYVLRRRKGYENINISKYIL